MSDFLSYRLDLDRPAEHAEPRIVDDILDIGAGGLERLLDAVTGIGLFEIAGNHDRCRSPGRRELAGQRGQTIGPARHQGDPVAIRRENPGEFRSYSR